MAYKALTKTGRDYLLSFGNNGTGLISGSHNYDLPNSNIVANQVQTPIIFNDNGDRIENNNQYMIQIINWIEKYSKQYGLDSNIISAQIVAESSFRTWAYSDSGALGLTQFLALTILDYIITNKFTSKTQSKIGFTQDEINIITNGVTDPTKKTSYFISKKQNRTQLYLNVINNPEIMIKAQCVYMASLVTASNNVAATCLFGYNRGRTLVRDTYRKTIIDTIELNKHTDPNYHVEGVKYVKIIFDRLYDKFGYNKDNTITKTFDPFNWSLG